MKRYTARYDRKWDHRVMGVSGKDYTSYGEAMLQELIYCKYHKRDCYPTIVDVNDREAWRSYKGA